MRNKRIERIKGLIEEAKGLYCSIYVTECFSPNDIDRLGEIEFELEELGYEGIESKSIEYVRIEK